MEDICCCVELIPIQNVLELHSLRNHMIKWFILEYIIISQRTVHMDFLSHFSWKNVHIHLAVCLCN